jgi:N-acetylmuramoyl-L-alanine amidase
MATTFEDRIKIIHQVLNVPVTGVFDITTCKAYEARKGINFPSADLFEHKKEIQKVLGFTGDDVDGKVGSNTIGRIENDLKISVTPVPSGTSAGTMKTLIIGAGHGGSDPGASGNGYIERDLAIEYRNLLVADLHKLGVNPIVDPDSNALKESLAYFRPYFNAESVNVDIHWNAGPPAATGTEVLINTNATPFEKQLGDKIATTIATTLGIRNRGLKTEQDSARGSLGWMHQQGKNYIVEMCFISNKTDMDQYQGKKHELSAAMAKILFDAIKQA